VLIANQMGALTSAMFGNPDENGVLGTWVGILAYTFQIYFDFSGYSDMACGLGNMFGFEFLKNFNYPYISTSITDFWRRWHISLSTWFKEYVYIPLGGNRKGVRRQIINLLIVWGLTGLWHGASYNFIFWGLYYFVFLAAEKLFLLKPLQKAPAVLRHGYALLVVVLGWVLFACENVTAAFGMYKTMLGIGAPLADSSAVFYLGGSVVMLLICTVGATELPKLAAQKLQSKLPEPVFRYVTYAVLALILFASMAFLVADSYNPFLYFRF
jgi:alginate O-acetyltransferase complex protein AlgI